MCTTCRTTTNFLSVKLPLIIRRPGKMTTLTDSTLIVVIPSLMYTGIRTSKTFHKNLLFYFRKKNSPKQIISKKTSQDTCGNPLLRTGKLQPSSLLTLAVVLLPKTRMEGQQGIMERGMTTGCFAGDR